MDAAGLPRTLRALSNPLAVAYSGTDADIEPTFGGQVDALSYVDSEGQNQTLVATENMGLGAVVNHFVDGAGQFNNTNTAYNLGLHGGTELQLNHLACRGFTWRYPINGSDIDTRTRTRLCVRRRKSRNF